MKKYRESIVRAGRLYQVNYRIQNLAICPQKNFMSTERKAEGRREEETHVQRLTSNVQRKKIHLIPFSFLLSSAALGGRA